MIPHRHRLIAGTTCLLLLGVTAPAEAAAIPQPRSQVQIPQPRLQIQIPQAGVVPQIPQPGAETHDTNLSGPSPQNVCEEGATWMRLRIEGLDLRDTDTLTLTGSTSGRLTLTRAHGRDRTLTTRSLRGDCVRVTPDLKNPASRYAVTGYESGATADVVVAGAGDICGSQCSETARLITAMNPAAVFTTGDNAYDSGTLSEYRGDYARTWGSFFTKTYPTPGNHEYNTSGAAGYFDYFGARAGARGQGYYSWDVGDWHFVALNSNISMSAGSAQEQWLRRDLAATTKPCTAAYLHHPLYNVGNHSPSTGTRPLWKALYDHKADLLLAGHDHNYQRWAPQDHQGAAKADGVREILVGTGGRSFYGLSGSNPANLQAKNANTHGVLKLTLSSTGYRFDFVPIAGRTFTDSGSATCHRASTSPDFGVSADPVTVAPGASATAAVRVSSLNGFASATQLTVSGQPSGVTASISPSSVTPPAGGTADAALTVTAAPGTPAGTHSLTVTGTSGALTRTAAVALRVGTPAVFADDFESDRGWTVNAAGADTATTGRWQRGDPEETAEEGVKQLGATVSGVNALVTGRLAGSGPGAHDVDGGVTSMRSPEVTLPAGAPTLTFSYAFAHRDNAGPEDFFRVKVGTSVVFERKGTSGADLDGAWTTASADLSAFAGQTVRITVEAGDMGGASLVEAAVDDVSIGS